MQWISKAHYEQENKQIVLAKAIQISLCLLIEYYNMQKITRWIEDMDIFSRVKNNISITSCTRVLVLIDRFSKRTATSMRTWDGVDARDTSVLFCWRRRLRRNQDAKIMKMTFCSERQIFLLFFKNKSNKTKPFHIYIYMRPINNEHHIGDKTSSKLKYLPCKHCLYFCLYFLSSVKSWPKKVTLADNKISQFLVKHQLLCNHNCQERYSL